MIDNVNIQSTRVFDGIKMKIYLTRNQDNSIPPSVVLWLSTFHIKRDQGGFTEEGTAH